MNLKKAQESADKHVSAKGANPKKKIVPPRDVDRTNQFKSDWLNAVRSGKHDMARVKQAMMLLIQDDGPLPEEWLDHPLSQNGKKWKDCRELHVKGDLLLIYQLNGDCVVFTRLGTHHQLFGT